LRSKRKVFDAEGDAYFVRLLFLKRRRLIEDNQEKGAGGIGAPSAHLIEGRVARNCFRAR